MSDIQHLPLADINANALPRDRGALNDAAFDELYNSILRDGLRQPIEVFPLMGKIPFGLISGFRRFSVYERLAGIAKFDKIPVFVRELGDIPSALRLMIEENSIRDGITPWDQGRIIVQAVERGYFDTYDAAVNGLHPSISRQKQARLRSLAEVFELFDGILADPEQFSQRHLLRLANAARGGYGDLMIDALRDGGSKSGQNQNDILENIVFEAEAAAVGGFTDDKRQNHPRRRVPFRPGLTVRRAMERDGWTLIFTGSEAKGRLMEDIMDYLEYQFGKE